MMAQAPNNHYPWRQGNRFRLLYDGIAFYPAMLEAIQQAQDYILLEMYLIESGEIAEQFIQALQEAANRGVRIYIIIDDLGSIHFHAHDRLRLQSPNIQLYIYNPLRLRRWLTNVYRDHRKQLTVDGRITFTGGMGISDVFYQGHENPWRETVLQIEGEMINDWQQLFIQQWQHWMGETIVTRAALALAEQQKGRLLSTRGGDRLELKRSLIQQIRRSQSRIWITTAYFMPSRKVRRELRLAVQRGVDVRLLLPGHHTDHPSVRYAGRRYYRKLLEGKVRIFEYQPSFIHAKVIICDDWLTVGSANFDRWSFRWALEANQEIDSPLFSQQAAQQFLLDQKAANEIHLHDWLNRSLWQRMHEWLWGRVDRIMEFTHKRSHLARKNPYRRK
ncbi:MAG: phosphatidylserine/phosphatidylglycerophosphate/cardiolipin synthase family protein [Gammaproteobacteria bacterium]|nr:phosphatidylserine/phosphatidylglycerophosphate/cardiolipin synthase family protein [Gammaproteobacteria bacterium]